jgi:hypothetical protein
MLYPEAFDASAVSYDDAVICTWELREDGLWHLGGDVPTDALPEGARLCPDCRRDAGREVNRWARSFEVAA